MALYKKQQHNEALLAIWKLEESEKDLFRLLSYDRAFLAQVAQWSSKQRRLEWLAVRALVQELGLDAKSIAYLPSGKPYLKESEQTISISHTKGYVAVIIGNGVEVGIDIEQYGNRVYRVADRFIGKDEKPGSYQGDKTWGLLLHWSAKEVLFKMLACEEVDFLQHLVISPFEVYQKGQFSAVEYRTTMHQHFQLNYCIDTDFVLVWSKKSAL